MGNFYSKNDVTEETYPADDTPITLNKVTIYENGEPTSAEDFVFGQKYYLGYQILKNETSNATSLIVLPTPFEMKPPPDFAVDSFDVKLIKKKVDSIAFRCYTVCTV